MTITRLLAGVLLFVGIAGCGSPDATSTSAPTEAQSNAESADAGAFCDAAEDLEKSTLSASGYPTDSQLDRLLDSAPVEIKEVAEILVVSARQFRAGNQEAADSERVQDAGDRFDAYVEESCKDTSS